MDAALQTIELYLQRLGGAASLATLAYSITNMLAAQKRPSGQHTGAAEKVLRTPYLVTATLVFIALGILLWKPLPIWVAAGLQFSLSIAGVLILLISLAVYIWGLRTLGKNFNASSGFGVRLMQTHQLVTAGPFRYLRHPMYVAVILAGWGGLLLYHTWSTLVFAVMMLGLIYRGQTEEKALAQAFGAEWEAYKRKVPGWIPQLKPGVDDKP